MKKNKKIVLLTGCNGYIGSAMSLFLTNSNYRVIGIDNKETTDNSDDFIFYKGDFADENLLKKILDENKKISFVIHLAASTSVFESQNNPEKYTKNNVLKSEIFFKFLYKNEITNWIFASTSNVYSPEGISLENPLVETSKEGPKNNYAKTKLITENFLKDFSINKKVKIIIFRYFNVVGFSKYHKFYDVNSKSTLIIPTLFKNIKKSNSFSIFGNDYDTKDGTAIRDYIFIDDLNNIHLNALSKITNLSQNIEVFNICSQIPISNFQLVNQIKNKYFPEMKILFKEKRDGDLMITLGSKNKTSKYFEYHYEFDLDKIIDSAYNFYIKNG